MVTVQIDNSTTVGTVVNYNDFSKLYKVRIEIGGYTQVCNFRRDLVKPYFNPTQEVTELSNL